MFHTFHSFHMHLKLNELNCWYGTKIRFLPTYHVKNNVEPRYYRIAGGKKRKIHVKHDKSSRWYKGTHWLTSAQTTRTLQNIYTDIHTFKSEGVPWIFNAKTASFHMRKCIHKQHNPKNFITLHAWKDLNHDSTPSSKHQRS